MHPHETDPSYATVANIIIEFKNFRYTVSFITMSAQKKYYTQISEVSYKNVCIVIIKKTLLHRFNIKTNVVELMRQQSVNENVLWTVVESDTVSCCFNGRNIRSGVRRVNVNATRQNLLIAGILTGIMSGSSLAAIYRLL